MRACISCYMKVFLWMGVWWGVTSIQVPSEEVSGSKLVSKAAISNNGTAKPINSDSHELEPALDDIAMNFRAIGAQGAEKMLLQKNGDVIHVIEPPKSFEELKKRMRSQRLTKQFNLQETVPEMSPHQPPPPPPPSPSPPSPPSSSPLLPPSSASSISALSKKPAYPIIQHFPPKHSRESNETHENRVKKVSKRHRRHPLLPTLTAPTSLMSRKRVKKTLDENDLHVEESHRMPMGILTSVRKTKRLIKKSKPKLHKAKQRIISRKFNTVIWEKGQERKQFEKGQEKRVTGIREHFSKAPSSAPSMPSSHPHRSYRMKRNVGNFDDHLPFIFNKPLTGEELLQHINGLLENATFYLSTIEDIENEPTSKPKKVMGMPNKMGHHDNRPAASTVSAARVTTLTVNKTKNYSKPQSRITTVMSNHHQHPNYPNRSGVFEAEQQMLHSSLRAVDDLVDYLRTRTNTTTSSPAVPKTTVKEPLRSLKGSIANNEAKGTRIRIPFQDEANDFGTTTTTKATMMATTTTTTTTTMSTTLKPTTSVMSQNSTMQPEPALISSVIRKVVPKFIGKSRNPIKLLKNLTRNSDELNKGNESALIRLKSGKLLQKNLYGGKAQLANDYLQDQKAMQVPINGSLIYNDVMTTIRNMLHSKYIYEFNNVLPDNMTDGIENILLLERNKKPDYV